MTYNRDTYIHLVGAVIRHAISDYKSRYLKKNRPRIWLDAKEFLFKDQRLEKFLENFGLQDTINLASLRRKAKYAKVRDWNE